MSLGRRIEQADEAPSKWPQRIRLTFILLCLALDVSMLRRWGFPPRLAGVAWAMGIITGLAALLSLASAYRQWPRARVFRPIRRMERRMDPNRRLKLTREGRILLGITIAVGVAAVNTGNNFLYLVVGLLLALVSVSGVLSELVLRHVGVRLEPGGERFARQQGVLAFVVANTKRRMGSLSMEVKPLLAAPGAAETEKPIPLPGRFILRLMPGDRERAVVRACFERRGVYRLLGFEVATAYPFGFFRKWKHEIPHGDEPTEVLVYPEPAPAQRERMLIHSRLGERQSGRPGKGEEFYSLRPHRDGDDPRHIAWKRSGRTGRLLLRQDEEPRSRSVVLVLAGGVQNPTEAQREDFERAVSLTTGLMLELMALDDEVGLVAGTVALSPRKGSAARQALLDALARVEIGQTPAPLPRSAPDAAVVLVEGPGDAPELHRVDVRLTPRDVPHGRRAA